MNPGRADDLDTAAEGLGQLLGHEFRDLERLNVALTHASARGTGRQDYQRLEFLGDRVLGIAVAEMLYDMFPEADEGELSLRLNALVNARICAEIGSRIELDRFIRTGSDIKTVHGRKGTNLRADVMEALIAAVYLEGGLQAVRTIIDRYWRPLAEIADAGRRDAKTELQEWAHRRGAGTPVYRVESREGPDHDPLFSVSVKIPGIASGIGTGRTKRGAEQAAAKQVLIGQKVWAAPENGQ